MNDKPLIGIIANPASGKDIRRLVAHAASMDNSEKIGIVRRLLIALNVTCPCRVRFMPDAFGIVQRAASGFDHGLDVQPLPMACVGAPSDSEEAARRLVDLGAAVIVTLGGDGTNRMVARGAESTPLMPISTGTNNVFPFAVEGTIAGLALGSFLKLTVPDSLAHRLIEQRPRLDISLDGEDRDIALIDAVATTHRWAGSRAIWRPDEVRQIVLSGIYPGVIGMASLGWLLFPERAADPGGVSIVLKPASKQAVLAPLAPGTIARFGIQDANMIEPGDVTRFVRGPFALALDGEREFMVSGSETLVEVRVNPHGPRVLNIQRILDAAARSGMFVPVA